MSAESVCPNASSATRGLPLNAYMVEAACWLLVASVLFQKPLIDFTIANSALAVHSWDVVWLALIAATIARFLALRRRDFRDLKPPVRSFLLYAGVVVVSLVWTAITFRTDGLAASGVQAGRFALVAYAVVVLPLVLNAAALRRVVLVAATAGAIAGAEALYAYHFETKTVQSLNGPVELGVTRPGGPFGNYFADGTPDHSWAHPAGATNLGLWLAVTVAMLLAVAVTPAGSSARARLSAALALIGATGALVALAVTGSREAWFAGFLVLGLLAALWRGLLRPRTWAFLGLVLLIGGVLVLTLAAGTRERIADTFRPGTFSFETGPRARTDAWLDGLRIGLHRFPIGWGIGGVEEHAGRFGRATAENVVIQAWMQTGLVGVALLLGWFWSTLRWAARSVRQLRLDFLALFAAVVMLSVVAQGVFGYSLGDPTVQILVATSMSAIAVLQVRSRGRCA
jgi:hypothetical protein